MYTCSPRILLSNTHFAILLRSDTDVGLMHTRSVRNLLSDKKMVLCFVVTYTRSARILLSDTHFAILLRSDTDVGVMYTHVLLEFCFGHTSRYNVSF